MNKSLVLLSAGLDSTVNFFLAYKKTQVKQTLTFNYGQRAAEKEIQHAQKISSYLKVPHRVIDLPWLKDMSGSSLTNETFSIPTGSDVSIDDLKTSIETAKSVWVPNRNGVFLNIAASIAEALQLDEIVPGFNLEEAQTFPDNTQDFILASTEAFKFSTQNQVKVNCYTIKMNKTEIVKEALKEQVPLELIWPCYFNGERWCGECESCQRTRRALSANNVKTEGLFK